MDSASCSGQIVDAEQMRRFFEMSGANGNVAKLAVSPGDGFYGAQG
jgi:hypothetical protein